MTNEMKALVKAKPEPGLWMETRPVPEIGPDDVLIRINKTGICGTDIHIWNWDAWAQRTVPVPLVTGHEFAGQIVEIGKNVEGLTIGQRCSGEGHLIGKTSRQSRSGKFHLDPETRGIGVNEPGAFAQYLRLPAFNVVPLGVSPVDGTLGYPIVQVFISGLELRGVLEFTLALRATQDDFNLGWAGIKVEYDATRPPVTKSTDLFNKDKGQVMRVSLDTDHSDGFEQFDKVIYDREAGTDNADFDSSGFVDVEDFSAFVQAFEAGC